MAYLVKDTITLQNASGMSSTHAPDTVLSDWEVSEFVREQLARGVAHYRRLLEPLTDREAENARRKATTLEGPRSTKDGESIPPPFPDYVGLHPDEIIEQMRTLNLDDVQRLKRYERAGLNRLAIINYVAPAEREPFNGYDEMSVQEVLEKMAVLSDADVEEIIVYEILHMRRPAIIQYDRATYEPESASEAPGAATEGGFVAA